MSKTCNECIKGSIHKGQPVGTEEVIHNLNTYVVGNRTNPKSIIVLYSDVFGLALPNNKLLADAYAKGGDYLVYLPDFFKGDPVPLHIADILIPVDAKAQSTFSKYTGLLANIPTYLMWASRHKHEPTDQICRQYLAALRQATPKEQKIGMVGICWGGRYALRAGLKSNSIQLNGTETPLVDAVVVLHPSNVSYPDDVAGLCVPVSYGWGLEDTNTKIEQKSRVQEIESKATDLPPMDTLSTNRGVTALQSGATLTIRKRRLYWKTLSLKWYNGFTNGCEDVYVCSLCNQVLNSRVVLH